MENDGTDASTTTEDEHPLGHLRPLVAQHKLAVEQAAQSEEPYHFSDNEWRKDEVIDNNNVTRRGPLSLDSLLLAADDLHHSYGHYGTPTTAAEVFRQLAVTFSAAKSIAREVVLACEECQYTQKPSMPSASLNPIAGGEAFDVWGTDFVGPLPVRGGTPTSTSLRLLTTLPDGLRPFQSSPVTPTLLSNSTTSSYPGMERLSLSLPTMGLPSLLNTSMLIWTP